MIGIDREEEETQTKACEVGKRGILFGRLVQPVSMNEEIQAEANER